MRTLGIDPGISGALALLTADNLTVWDMPTIELAVNGKKRRRLDIHAFRDLLVDIGPVNMVVLEEVASMPRDGGVQAFAFGRTYGAIEGVLCAIDRPVALVRPAAWTRKLGVGADKGAHRAAAMRLYPAHADRFKRVCDDGRADAALIASWWMWEGMRR